MALDSLYKGVREAGNSTTITTTTTLTAIGNQFVHCDVSGAGFTVTLPHPAEQPWCHIVLRKIGGGTNILTVVAPGEGPALTTLEFAGVTEMATMEDDGDFALFISNGVFWMYIGQVVGD